MSASKVAFIGLGLIGGSIAKALKRSDPDITIMAYMRTRNKLVQAQQEGTIDVILEGIGEELSQCDMIFLCTPVEYNAQYLKSIQPFLKSGTILTDVGSTKTNIHQEVISLGLEEYFIGGHPMAGSEKTGYENSTDHLLENAYYLLTPTAKSSPLQIECLIHLAKAIGALPIVLDYEEHDFVVACISHLPHIVASSLVNLVKTSDNPQGIMKQVAAGGFKDITRIASASPEMWEQICMTNSNQISAVLERYISYLQEILQQIQNQNNKSLYSLFDTSRTYRDSISDKMKGSIIPDYSFTVDIVDEAGAISTLSVILAAKGINIKNIGINHNREHGEGALRISFYNEDAREAAWAQLKKYNYELMKS